MLWTLYLFWITKAAIIGFMAYRFWLRLGPLRPRPQATFKSHPKVCIQLPIFNEPDHVSGLLSSVLRLDWPHECLEIQILDDSTDKTSDIIDVEMKKYAVGFPSLCIHHLRRDHRRGYKAGALNFGLQESDAEFFVIFDCDFRPPGNFLKAMRLFASPDVAAVQVPWDYYNREMNLLTEVQGVFLDSHFFVEQRGRQRRGLYFNFNGAAGIWRRSALQDLGGWAENSVTEDLFLSYQAWLKGYTIVLDEGRTCPSELPQNLSSFLVQQRRWAKGNGQVLRALWRNILKRGAVAHVRRFDMFYHLCGYGIASIFLVLIYGSLPFWLGDRAQFLQTTEFLSPVRILDAALWLLGGTVMGGYYRNIRKKIDLWSLVRILLLAPLLNMWVAYEFWRGVLFKVDRKSLVFYRTPKRTRSKGNLGHRDLWIGGVFSIYVAGNAVFALYQEIYLAAVILGFQVGVWVSSLKSGIGFRQSWSRVLNEVDAR